MTCCKIDPLRTLTDEERDVLTHISRSGSEPASHVARAKALLAVADGKSYTEAAHAASRRSGDAVSHLVSRFNQEGLAALAPRHGGSRARWHRHLVADHLAAGLAASARRVAAGKYLHHLDGPALSWLHRAGQPDLV